TRAWIAAQNELTQAWLGEVGERERLRERLRQLWDHPRRDAPWREGERWFQLRNSGLEDQDVLWTMDAPGDEGRVLLDPNRLSDDGSVALSGAAVSRDGAWLAYATSDAGSDWMTWHVRPTGDGEDLDEALEWSKFSGAAWAPDGSGFFYARYDAPPPGESLAASNRNQRLWFHRPGTSQDTDVLVYERPDEPEWSFAPTVTEDGRYLVLEVWQGTDHRNRVFLADFTRARGGEPESRDSKPAPDHLEIVELLADFDARYDFAGNIGPVCFFSTDLEAPRGRLIAIDLRQPSRDRWREIIPQSEATLERVHLAGGRFVAVYLDDAKHRLRRFTLDGGDEGPIALPGIGSVGPLSGKLGDRDLYFTFTSFTAPVAVCRHALGSGETTYLARPGLDLDPDRFETEQVFVPSSDGERVPMFLIRRADLPHPGEQAPVEVPTLLYGYGGFNIALTPAFRVWWMVWLELGGQLAVANLRGGSEYGEQWHAAGRGERKQQVFDDAIACAQALVDAGWTTPAKLAITGASNGGLLAGACLTQRPDLFGACVPEVGVLDMLRFHRFTIGWAWVSDYGSAEDPEQFKILLAYSPLHNLWPRTAYPATLLVTGDHDDRVVPGHSFKFAAALQAAQGGDAPVLIRVQTDAGHGAGKPTSVSIAERADVLAFLVRALGLQEEES
ncbi:MAG: prolyl oligopeptidase family serine peptidase, partial [Nitriliruptorales bacterium]|nr:prolyl oligopeptidase family serine peptidase [Nitriliruptorales bacterium]